MAAHETLVSTRKVAAGSDRSFGKVFTVFFLFVAFAPLLHGHGHRGSIRVWALPLAALFLLVTILRPSLLAPLNRLWFRFGELLSKITTPIIMGLFFFLAVTPLAWLSRLVGRDPLRLRRDDAAHSYWIVRGESGLGATPTPDSLRQQF